MNREEITDLRIVHTGKFGHRGEVINVLLGDDVIASSYSPEFSACRVLKERGYSGMVRFWRDGKACHDLQMGVDWGSQHCVSEPDRVKINFAKWAPFSRDAFKADASEHTLDFE